MNLSTNLKHLRKQRGLSQQRVSQMNDFYRSTYSGWENRVSEPNLCDLVKLAKFYNVTLDKLIR